MTVFALVHGGQHGAWSWELLIPELHRRGHVTVAIDLPVEDATAGAARYAELVAESLRGRGDDVVAVGHSLGGLTIPLLPALTPVRRLVFVCAALPEPGRSYFESLATEGIERLGLVARTDLADADRTIHRSPPDLARAAFFHDVTPELQAWAIEHLRPQSRTPHREISPLREWPATPRSIVHGVDDRAIPFELARRRAARILGEEPIPFPGGHSPFLTRPAQLAELLTELAARG